MFSSTWRSDITPRERPTVHSVVPCAEDRVDGHDLYEVFVCHIWTMRGRGFMANVRRGTSSLDTGECHLGEGVEAYQRAEAEGRRLLAARVEQLDRDMVAYRWTDPGQHEPCSVSTPEEMARLLGGRPQDYEHLVAVAAPGVRRAR
jgi:hypothetical protein